MPYDKDNDDTPYDKDNDDMPDDSDNDQMTTKYANDYETAIDEVKYDRNMTNDESKDVGTKDVVLSCTEVFQGIRFFFIYVKYRSYHKCSRNQYRLMLHLIFHLLERSVKLCKVVR